MPNIQIYFPEATYVSFNFLENTSKTKNVSNVTGSDVYYAA
jgi:hypothetical protein